MESRYERVGAAVIALVRDLLARSAELVDIPSVSYDEAAIADRIEAQLKAAPWLQVDRVANSVVARTQLGRGRRLLLAGHLDTVPPNGNQGARIDGDTLWGLGATDMKGGLAVLCELAATEPDPVMDVTYVLYECEEVDQRHNGLSLLAVERPDLLQADAAVLAEPTGGRVEAGCQGTVRVAVTLVGERAHTARPWMGVNAVHRLAPVLTIVAGYQGRRPVIDGCEFRESLQAVGVEGSVAPNVVPDWARLVLNHRFAPDRDMDAAVASLRDLLGPALDSAAGDTVEVESVSHPAPPALDHPLLAGLVERSGGAPRAKLGWTDVAFFSGLGVPATNFGPGDSTLAHTATERVARSELDAAFGALRSLLLAVPVD
jgi:succinyl-diaminopimelate desuccinylase